MCGDDEGEDVSVTVAAALHECDVACLLYDSSDPKSFQVTSAMMVGVANPILWVWLILYCGCGHSYVVGVVH